MIGLQRTGRPRGRGVKSNVQGMGVRGEGNRDRERDEPRQLTLEAARRGPHGYPYSLVYLSGAYLLLVSLEGVSLEGVYLWLVSLEGAYLSPAPLPPVYLEGAYLLLVYLR